MLWERLSVTGLESGLSGIGVCDVDPFDDVRLTLEDRKASGLAGGLTFTYNDPVRSTDITRSFPWARRLVVAAHPYVPDSGSPSPPKHGTGRVARFATADHYVPLRNALGRLATLLTDEGYRAETLVDDNRLVDRAAAVRAGVAWWGKSTMVLAPGVGPWILLGSVVTDAELPETEPMVRDCGTCDACIPACPTGALISPGVLDARKCLAHLLQAAGSIPIELREAVGDRVYGCDECLDACPPGQRLIQETGEGRGRIDLLEALDLSDAELLERFDHFYIPRRRAGYLRRNLLVALGNSGGGDAEVTMAGGLLADPDPIVRSHAAWALGRLGGQAARNHLEGARRSEQDAEVVREIESALAQCEGSPAEAGH
ncbi:MAG: tRNA epoxyqueuosine(34) reductase QueG [Acidimicrobiia bacterium]|nr:tRNA epoxyqueuosine(34) reductase QueG [Acidimicrobiia bacterium]